MKRFFSFEGPVYEFLEKMTDLITLNILFLLTCIPVITIGMSTTALYRITFRMLRGECGSVAREYLGACREEWKKSTLLWIFFLLTGVVLGWDFLLTLKSFKYLAAVFMFAGLIWAFLFSYSFPLTARFENTVRTTVSNALLLSLRHLPVSLAVVVINAVLPVSFFLSTVVFSGLLMIYMLIGFALAARINGRLLAKVFRRYEPEPEPEAGAEDDENVLFRDM